MTNYSMSYLEKLCFRLYKTLWHCPIVEACADCDPGEVDLVSRDKKGLLISIVVSHLHIAGLHRRR